MPTRFLDDKHQRLIAVREDHTTWASQAINTFVGISLKDAMQNRWLWLEMIFIRIRAEFAMESTWFG